MISEKQEYKCCCKDQHLLSIELRSHLKLPGPHIITLINQIKIKTKDTNIDMKKKSEYRIELDYSAKYVLKSSFLIISSIVMRNSK